ncbi:MULTISPECIES: monocarboxylate uptake permease MctP [Dactylosporangium]|uniref:Solute:Na+ symporter, SSS family protein n=2 Tax=Dactylosporangium TaxID=35753 RepID=A0A9W6NJZ9_9ACTN|nr:MULTISPECIES: sodium:solute symporter [Dactylosporangium]UAB93793.1 sodium:solute symporter [Dactylosporangium vinaceum]UWZ42164.1 sodium:solute symporter [Dactylosporangium matsuzakiense]GLK99803.1 solute:Na+ symporter, SSS family protein [Dactylosporangium matsuzakiense]
MWRDHVLEIVVFVILFLAVSAMGFVAARWRRPDDLNHLDEWGLGGRNFGGWITWFLVGGDLYTAYTFVAVPALLFASGAAGFFAVPYTIIIYPLVFLALTRLWSVSHRHGFVTPADFVRARFQSPTLALVIAITGIVATMPYIALQLVGIESVLKTMGVTGSGTLARHLPIIIAFAILAAYTYSSGLRAPALIAFVKDILIYVVILVAVFYLPYKLGGWGSIFDAADAKFDKTPSAADGILLTADNQVQYFTLALGSALALFLYPHSITGVLASRNRDVIKRNMSALPAYSFLLGLIALLGFAAIAAGVTPLKNPNGTNDNNTVVPLLFDKIFPDWFAGVAYAAVGIGALVPAAIMSIAAANLFTRNIYREYLKRDATPAQESSVAKVVSLVVKFGALLFVVFVDPQFSIDLQLIGGVIILQTLPAVALGLFTRWFHRGALVAGWAAGMGLGLWMLYQVVNPTTKRHFAGSAFPLSEWGFDTKKTIYVGFVAVIVNLLVAVIVTLILRSTKVADGGDDTTRDDYFADEGDPRVTAVPTSPAPAATAAPDPIT